MVNTNPLVSVVIPTRDTKVEWLRNAIESVLSQSYQNIEILVIDDCGQVPFSGVRMHVPDREISWHRNHSNKGVSATRNKGAVLSEGKYLAFLDADDWWGRNKIALQIAEIQRSGTVWNYTKTVLCGPDGNNLTTIDAIKVGNIFEHLLKSQIIAGSCSGVMIKRSIFFDCGMFEDKESIVEDWDMWLRLAKNHPVSAIGTPEVFLRTGIQSRSRSVKGKIERLKRFQNKYHDEYAERGLLNYSRAHLYYVTSRQYFLSGALLFAAISLGKSFFSDPSYFAWGRIRKVVVSIKNIGFLGR